MHTYAPIISTTGVDFTQVFNEIAALIPVVLPVVVMFLAFRKGWKFLIAAVRGA